MSPIPCADPKAGYLAHRAELDAAVERVLAAGQYILGPEVTAFEAEFARFVGVSSAVGVGSGTDALQLALRACGIRDRQDAVLTVSHTATATVAAIELAGATPVLIDIDPLSYTLDPNLLEETLEGWSGGPLGRAGLRPRAIVPVHLYGHPADMRAIVEIARRRGLRVIEDCAQAHGAAIGGNGVGTFGDLAAFSFYPTKNLGALGDGGATSAGDPALAERMRRLREYGWKERFSSEEPGLNSRLDELQAALLRVKLKYLDGENRQRAAIAALYRELLPAGRLALPAIAPDVTHVFHLFVVRLAERDGLRAHLQGRGIGCGVHYPRPVHLQPAYRERVPHGAGGLARTEAACCEILSLPMYPQLPEASARAVAEAIVAWAARS